MPSMHPRGKLFTYCGSHVFEFQRWWTRWASCGPAARGFIFQYRGAATRLFSKKFKVPIWTSIDEYLNKKNVISVVFLYQYIKSTGQGQSRPKLSSSQKYCKLVWYRGCLLHHWCWYCTNIDLHVPVASWVVENQMWTMLYLDNSVPMWPHQALVWVRAVSEI